MANKKKDYRLYCLLLYTVSPSEVVQGRYKAGCRMARRGLPSKKCRNCKYGIDRLFAENDEYKG
jgi:hypothetical protein